MIKTLDQTTGGNHSTIVQKAEQAARLASGSAKPNPVTFVEHENMLDDNSPIVKSFYVPDGLCGFAWVTIRPATHPFVHYLKSRDIGGKSYYGGWEIFMHCGEQSIERKIAAAKAYAAVLKEYFHDSELRIGTGDRLD